MNHRILITYASRTGSTIGVAEAIAKILNENGASVDIFRIQDVHDISPYRSIVIGSAIQNRQWLPEATQFIKANQAALKKIPFAAFLVCMTLAMPNGEKYRPGIIEWQAPVRRLVKPVSEGQFAGALDIRKIPSFSDRLKFRLSVAMGVWKEGDHRNWDAINTWAKEITPLLVK